VEAVTVTKLAGEAVGDLLEIIARPEAKKVLLRVLAMSVWAARHGHGYQQADVDRVGAVWQAEREGIAKAKAQGRYKGCVPTVRSQAPEIVRLKASGMTPTEIVMRLRNRTGECLSGAGFAAKAAIRRQLDRTTATWVIPETYEDQGSVARKAAINAPHSTRPAWLQRCSTS
jgi:hypothetical protein